ncbi:MAG TPA: CPBP family intramembrane glutamic endopeptidase [Leptolyngbyaceae cyanobacterium]
MTTGSKNGLSSKDGLSWSLLNLVLPILALTLAISWVEEIIFRGFVVNQLHLASDWLGSVEVSSWGGFAIASLLFAVLHLVWDGPAGIPQLPGLALMGSVLILARWADGGLLGLPTGLHAGWICALALVDTLKLVTPVETSPRWLAGKPDQPLTGLLDIVLLLGTGVLLWGYGQTGAGHLF